jgi:hypothetical protein
MYICSYAVLTRTSLAHTACSRCPTAGAPDPKLSKVLGLQDSMLQQVQDYKQLAPQLEVHKTQHPYLRPVRKLPPGTIGVSTAAALTTRMVPR